MTPLETTPPETNPVQTNAAPMSLAQLQREMAAAVMMPLTPGEDMQAHAPDGRAMTAVAESFVAPNSRLSAFERLEIYNRQYWFRVLDALIDDFPALRAVVGAQIFEQLSIDYLQEHPSRSFSLRNLGSKLVEWLAAHPGLAGRRHKLALDVARIEWAFVEAFDNAEFTPLTLEQIGALNGESMLVLQPHVQLLALEFPADDLVLGLHDKQKQQRGEAGVKHEEGWDQEPARLPRLRPRPTWVVAHRVDNSVYYRRLAREEYLTLAAIRKGLPLGQALEAGFEGSRTAQARRPQMVREWFALWAELGWVCGEAETRGLTD